MAVLDGKVGIVTGATSGIGRGCALAMAAAGARLIVTGRNEQRGTETVAQVEGVGGTAHFVRQDVTQEEDWRQVVEEAMNQFGHIDFLVNNAGDALLGSINTLTLKDLQFLLRVDVEGPFLGMKYVWPHLKASGGGVILNMSSIAGQKALEGGIAYCSAKGALTSLTRGAAIEGARGSAKIRVNSIHPGLIWTEGVTDVLGDSVEAYKPKLLQNIPLGRFGEPDDVGQAAVFLVSDAAKHITGVEFNIDGGQFV